MIKVSTARPSDLDEVDPMPIFEHEKPFLHLLKDAVERTDCVAHTFRIDTQVIGCIGACLEADRVMTIWAWLSDHIKKAPIDFSKKCLLALDFYIKQLAPLEVYMYVKKDADSVVKWGNFLGFKKTSIVTGIDGTDYYKMKRSI